MASPAAAPSLNPLQQAKKVAVRQFLKPRVPTRMLTANAVSTIPDDNVVGIGVGEKSVAGMSTGELCIRFYVERKVPREAIPRAYLLPQEIEGVKTDVIEGGRFRALTSTPGVSGVLATRQRLRPAQPGCSVGILLSGSEDGVVMAGTLGAVVEADGRWYILSNNHVLANEDRLLAGSPVFQPGLLDGGNLQQDEIARVTRSVKLSLVRPNKVDCAIAEILDRSTVSPAFLPNVGILSQANPGAMVEKTEVEKVGRTTTYTTGMVFDASADINVQFGMGALIFEDQVLIRGDQGAFSEPGDSGSVIVDRKTKQAVGLLFAGTSYYTAANQLAEVVLSLGVRLVV